MANTAETGHAKNVTNFEKLLASVVAYGASYNPSRINLTVQALEEQLSSAKELLNVVFNAKSAYANAVDAQEQAFKPLGSLVTRIKNALKASDTSMEMDESVETIFRKLQGKRASAKLTDEEKKALEADGKEIVQISTSHMSYDSQITNTEELITHLTNVPQYCPNEPDLTVDGLTLFLEDLKTKNTAVLTTGLKLDSARNARNEVLYKPMVGIVDISADVKSYVKSVFGAASYQYKQVSKFTFLGRGK